MHPTLHLDLVHQQLAADRALAAARRTRRQLATRRADRRRATRPGGRATTAPRDTRPAAR